MKTSILALALGSVLVAGCSHRLKHSDYILQVESGTPNQETTFSGTVTVGEGEKRKVIQVDKQSTPWTCVHPQGPLLADLSADAEQATLLGRVNFKLDGDKAIGPLTKGPVRRLIFIEKTDEGGGKIGFFDRPE